MEISFGEMVVVLMIALLVLGPEDFASKAYSVGRFIGKLRTEFGNFKIMAEEQMQKKAMELEIKTGLAELKKTAEKTKDDLNHG